MSCFSCSSVGAVGVADKVGKPPLESNVCLRWSLATNSRSALVNPPVALRASFADALVCGWCHTPAWGARASGTLGCATLLSLHERQSLRFTSWCDVPHPEQNQAGCEGGDCCLEVVDCSALFSMQARQSLRLASLCEVPQPEQYHAGCDCGCPRRCRRCLADPAVKAPERHGCT